MRPHDKLKIKGNECVLFPLESLYVTRYHHKGDDYILDLIDFQNGKQILKAPLYAPVSMKCVHVGSLEENMPTVTWESLNPVLFVDGTIDYLTLSISHDDKFYTYKVGDVIPQGEVIGHTGTAGQVTGDHTHLIVGIGKYTGYMRLPSGQYTLKNQYPPDNAMGINNTIVVKPEDSRYPNALKWKYFEEEKPTKKLDLMPLSIVGALKWSV